MNPAVGVIGTGERSTRLALDRLNLYYRQRTSQEHTCPVLLVQPDFYEINRLLPQGIEQAAELLAPYFRSFKKDVDCIILINNTLHQSLDIILARNKFDIPILHMGQLLKTQLRESGVKKVAILGTVHTMNSTYFKKFIPDTTRVLTVPEVLQTQVDELRKIYYYKQDQNLVHECVRALNEQFDNDTILVVACTELSIAFENQALHHTVIDTLNLVTEKAIERLPLSD